MPLTMDAVETSSDFQKRKAAQWNKYTGPNLQLVRTNNNSQWMMVFSSGDFYEGVIIGQLERIEREETRVRRGFTPKDKPNAKKRIENRGIDLTDEQVEKVLQCWKAEKSAAKLAFVPCVWGKDGEPVES